MMAQQRSNSTVTKVTKLLCFVGTLLFACPTFGQSAIHSDTQVRADRRLAQRELPPRASEAVQKSENKLRSIVKQAVETEGAIFVDQNKISVKAPILTALIELHKDLSPYAIDASANRSISLREVLTQALAKNLEIEISSENMQSSKWLFRSAL